MTQIAAGGAIASSQADVTWRGILCWREMPSAVWGMTQHRDPGSSSLCFLTRATNPRLSSHNSSSLCLPSAGSQSVGLQTENFVLALKRLPVSLAVSPWWTETAMLFTPVCYLGFFPSSGA